MNNAVLGREDSSILVWVKLWSLRFPSQGYRDNRVDVRGGRGRHGYPGEDQFVLNRTSCHCEI